MASFTMDMSKERKPRELFKEGESVVKILSMEYQTSKNGNPMFKCEIKQEITSAVDIFYFVAEEGKRWLLKSLLDATGQYKKNAENKYEFDTEKVIGSLVLADIYHEEQPYIKPNGEEIKVKQNRIRIFKKSEYTIDNTIDNSNVVSTEVGTDEEIPF